MKNAELRQEVAKGKRDYQELSNIHLQVNEQVRQLEKQRKKDCDYILKQESELEKMREARMQAINLAKVQEE
jgi:hypothetical protein